MDTFKVPQSIPQDLLLIQELIGAPQPSTSVPQPLVEPPPIPSPSKPEAPQDNDDISSSGEDTDSEDEIATDLIAGAATDEDDLAKATQKSL
jgi:H/ACA ribonucleoprotein complex non-core subunit NAF1